jgi:thiopeptide-type bacteriocin biosynthesis protein
VPWVDLQQTLERWRSEERFARAYFMRKPPGLRLRFSGPEIHRRIEPDLVDWLEDAERQNTIRGFRFAVYEPELYRFGGSPGMTIAHEQFDADSRLVLSYETLGELDQAALPRDLFSLIATNDLISRCVDDRAELGEVWQQLRVAVTAASPLPLDAGDLGRESDALMSAPAFTGGLTPATCALLDDARSMNERTARRLHAAIRAERLSVGVRAWLAAICIFHWNRLGLTTDELGPMVSRMLRLLDSATAQP